MQPNGNVIVDTICRIAEHGDSYRYRSRVRRAPQASSQENHEQAPQRHPSPTSDTQTMHPKTGRATKRG
ncbi:hypothetical protein FRC0265_01979 [Corynebacterium diphtheriae]|nr:hypothetical protein FRC0265_01979 [Corynebacterium diphtheriae]